MSPRVAIRVLGGLLLLPGAGVSGAQKPNIIFILTDDLGYGDVNCYGADTNLLHTPRIDQLAREGILFRDAHAAASTCTPSRYSFLTGEYAWRTPGTGIASGIDPLLIPAGSVTVPSMLRGAGYATAGIGKWHLGLGSGVTDYNHSPIEPGPLEVGFDYYFGPPATGDRVPCVFIENHSIYGYDPADPLLVSYSAKVGNLPTGTERPDLLTYYDADVQHSRTIINGISRIGWMDGVTNAWWRDQDFADVFVAKASAFMEANTNTPFFLYLATHDIHVPHAPHERFQGTSGHAWRGDAIHSMDWTVGAIVDKVEALNLTSNTLIICTSDNGPVLNDGYDDDYADGISIQDYGAHNLEAANGPFRGGKYTLWEGGTRVPFLVRWPGVVPSNTTSSALISQTDMLASLAALVGQPLPTDAGPDSQDVLPALLGQSTTGRTEFVGQNNNSDPRSLRVDNWKYLSDSGNLYDLSTDPAEASNLSGSNPSRAAELASRLNAIAAIPMRSSLMGWWPLSEGAGDGALDRSANGYTGACSGSPSWVTEDAKTFLRLDGIDDQVMIPGLPPTVGDLTFGCWARSGQSTWNADGCLMSRRPQFALHPVQGTTRLEAQFYDTAGEVQALSFDLAGLAGFRLTDWHHYAASFQASTGQARLFVDGLLRTEATFVPGALGFAQTALTLGSDGGNPGTFLEGDLADVRIYDQVLTGQRMMNTASGRLLDADADAMLDDWEVRYGLDPFDPADALLDSDGDGITNGVEFVENTLPVVPVGSGPGGLLGYWSLDEALAVPVAVHAAEDPPGLPAVTEAPPEAVAAWQALRFGLFIHWGPVSLTGKEIGWSRGRETPIEVYDRLYQQFDPTHFDAEAWVRTAREAGMRYLVITTKHHDGFCLWPSGYTDYDMGETPFGRDVLRELSDVCRRQGIRFGTYYSVCDWHHPAFPMGSPGGQSRKPNPDLAAYDQYLQGQVEELVTRYGPLVSLWFDVPQVYTAEYGIPMVNRLRELQPDIVINDRAYAEDPVSHEAVVGDFSTPEQRVGGFDRERPWETCMTLCRQWAWKPGDAMKSLEECVQTLLRVVGGDGNLLFNVGPMPDGRIEPRQVERLREMGAWVTRYGDGIYGTRGGPYRPGQWGASTCKGNRIYLFVMDWPSIGPLVLPALAARVEQAESLGGGQVRVEQEGDALRILLPEADRQAIATVIRLDLDRTAFDVPPMQVPRVPSASVAFDLPAEASNVFRN